MTKKRVGYWMKLGKAKRINLNLIEEILSTKYNIELIELDPGPLSDMPTVDVVFHKMSDLIFDAKSGKESSIEHLNCFISYFENHRKVRVFDPLQNVEVLLDRVFMLDAINKCSMACAKDRRFYSCGYHLVTDTNLDTLPYTLKCKDFRYPVMCKSRIAQGAQGHDMSLIFNEDGLKHVKRRNIIVPFIDHNAVLYKIFVCGKRFHVVTRPSITLDKFLTLKSDVDSYHFHSDSVSKISGRSTRIQEDLCGLDNFEETPLSEDYHELISEWVQIIRQILNLSLFGFDLIFEAETKKPFIIDVNYFPGYDGFENFHSTLSEMLYEATIVG